MCWPKMLQGGVPSSKSNGWNSLRNLSFGNDCSLIFEYFWDIMLHITEFFTHTPYYEASTRIPNSGENFWVFWGLNWTKWAVIGHFAVLGATNWYTHSNATNFTANSTVNWLVLLVLQDLLQTPILMGSRGSTVTRWWGEHGTSFWRLV